MLRDWRRIALQVPTQGQVRTEVAWFNFAPGRMHWAGHAGRDMTDRQRIKRKAARWAEGYRKMPLGERLAVVPAITDPPFFGAGPLLRRAGPRTFLFGSAQTRLPLDVGQTFLPGAGRRSNLTVRKATAWRKAIPSAWTARLIVPPSPFPDRWSQDPSLR